MSLITDYRPKTFEEILGNKSTVDSLKHHVNNPDRPKVYLFQGVHGVGKTSLARIMATSLDYSYEEVNISDDNGVTFAREFVNKVKYKGFDGNKVYIMDEVQRLTKDAQNILLKTLEEPPNHIVVVLCTTDTKGLLPSLMSRCVKYEISPPKGNEIRDYLFSIAYQEKIILGEGVLDRIIKECEANPRECLSMLETLRGVEEQDQIDLVKKGVVSGADVMKLCRAILADDWNTVYSTALELDMESAKRAIEGYMLKVLGSFGAHQKIASKVLFRLDSAVVGKKSSIINALFIAMRG